MVTAKKTSHFGTTYRDSRNGAFGTYWACGRGFMVRASNGHGCPVRYSFWKRRSDAVDECGCYVDPAQNGRYIQDNAA